MSAPDTLVESIIETLSVFSFDGVPAAQFWDTIESQLKTTVDSFTRNVVWQWLLRDPRFLIGEIQSANGGAGRKPKMEFSSLSKDLSFDEILHNNYLLKVDDDYQSVYLTGVKAKDNILGKMPYELLRIIAKNRLKGINSLDLIKQSGQDPRSLTNRLQVLEDNQLIVKMGVSAGKHNTNHMYHFRFIKSNTIIISDDNNSTEPNDQSEDLYDRYVIITQIMKALKLSPKEMPVRLTRDLFEELKVIQPGLKLRWFNSILRLLVIYGYAEMVQVEHDKKKRFFPAVRYLKDLPDSTNKTDLMNKIREQEKLDEAVDGLNDKIDDPIPQFNRFLPLVNQIRDFVNENQECMISDIENKLTSVYKTKQLSNFIENIMCTNENLGQPGHIIGQIIHLGKIKMYKLMTFDYWNKTTNQENNKDFQFSTNGSNDAPLMKFNADYLYNFAFDRKVEILELSDEETGELKTFMVWKVKKNSPLKFVTKRSSLYEGIVKSKNGLLELHVSSKKVEMMDINTQSYLDQVATILKLVHESNEKNEIFDFPEIDEEIETITVKEPIESNSSLPTSTDNEISAPVDLGPKRRREILLEEVNSHKCICICVEFCNMLSTRLNLDYLIDRRTLIRDTAQLEKEGLVKSERFEDRKFIVKSIINEPSYDDILLAIKEPTKKNNTSRVFTGKVSFDKVVLFDEKNLKRGLKFPDKEARLQYATERHRDFIGETGRVVRRQSRKRKTINVSDDSSNEAENSDQEGNQTNDEGDIIGPMMDKRKRKKFKPNSKQQARVVRAFKKIRTSVKMEEDHILLFIKAIIVTQSLSPGTTIDWPKVAKVFNDAYTSETLRRMWPRYKKLLGFKNVTQARKNWETVLINAVEKRIVTEDDLLKYDVFKMLELWKTEGTEIFMSKSQMVIAKEYEDNFKGQHFEPLKEDIGVDVYKEPPSLIEKEQVWTMRSFAYPINYETDPDEFYKTEAVNPSLLQKAKIKLKSLFATSPSKFSGSLVKKLFENIPKEVYAKALTDLEDEKAIAFLGEESNIKFTLTDKVLTILDSKLTPEFIESARNFENVVKDVDTSHTGILLSTTCPVGTYAPLFNYIANNAITVTRIDQKPLSLDTYSTKSRDRSKLESDFLLSHFDNHKLPKIKPVKPDTGTPCSFIWVDLHGDFNSSIWKRCICVILWEILFHPGTKIGPLCRRVKPLLEPSEVQSMIDWMKARRCITQDGEGYWATKIWYDVF